MKFLQAALAVFCAVMATIIGMYIEKGDAVFLGFFAAGCGFCLGAIAFDE